MTERKGAPSVFSFGGSIVPPPTFFPSVSSVKATETPAEEAEFLMAVGAPYFLVSAYDYINSAKKDSLAIKKSIKAARSKGAFVLLDSGNYESFWHGDKTWSRKHFYRAAREISCNAAFSYDGRLKNSPETNVARIIQAAQADHDALPGTHLIPIVHLDSGNPRGAVKAIAKVAKKLKAQVIAIAERELGSGIEVKARFIMTAQNALVNSGQRTRLHVLGTGNPLALLAYSVAGADTFDGLEWCRTVVDHDTGLLFHFQQYDFFKGQTVYGEKSLPFAIAGRAHNLTFMDSWIKVLREARKLADYESTLLSDYCAKYKPSSITPALQSLLASLAPTP